MKLLILFALLTTVNAREISKGKKDISIFEKHRKSKNIFQKESITTKINTFAQDSLKIISEIWGLFYIKSRTLRNHVSAYKNRRISKLDFQELKRSIKKDGRYYDLLTCSLYPLEGDSVRLEIERTSSKKRRFHHDDGSERDMDYSSLLKSAGVTYYFDFLILTLNTDYDGNLQVGYRAEFEHNFYRGFLGIEYQATIWKTIFRFGSGFSPTGIFQFNFTMSEKGKYWKMSRGKLSSNLRLTPQHIIGELYPYNSIGKLEILRKNHALRFYYGLQPIKSSFRDTFHITDKTLAKSFRAEYSLNYFDDNRHPISGVYFNAKYQSIYATNKKDDLPYELGNEYAIPLYNKGTYNTSYFGNLQLLLNYYGNTAIHIGVQTVYQHFNTSRFDYSNPKIVGEIGFNQQELQMLTLTAGLRKRFDESIFEIIYGINRMKLYSNIQGDINDHFIEIRYISEAFEIKYHYIFDQVLNNPMNINNFEKYIHHHVGAVFSIGISFGSLY